MVQYDPGRAPPEDAPLQPTGLRTDREYVHPGEKYTTEFTVENTGDETAQAHFTYSIDGNALGSFDVEVPPGETRAFTNRAEFARGHSPAIGEHTIRAGGLTTGITVLKRGEPKPEVREDTGTPVGGKFVGSLDLTHEHVHRGRWLKENTVVRGIELAFGDEVMVFPLDSREAILSVLPILFSRQYDSSRSLILDGELHPRVTRGPMPVVAQRAEDAGLFTHDAKQDHSNPGTFKHVYLVDGVEHRTMTFRYDPQASKYGSIDFYVDDPVA